MKKLLSVVLSVILVTLNSAVYAQGYINTASSKDLAGTIINKFSINNTGYEGKVPGTRSDYIPAAMRYLHSTGEMRYSGIHGLYPAKNAFEVNETLQAIREFAVKERNPFNVERTLSRVLYNPYVHEAVYIESLLILYKVKDLTPDIKTKVQADLTFLSKYADRELILGTGRETDRALRKRITDTLGKKDTAIINTADLAQFNMAREEAGYYLGIAGLIYGATSLGNAALKSGSPAAPASASAPKGNANLRIIRGGGSAGNANFGKTIQMPSANTPTQGVSAAYQGSAALKMQPEISPMRVVQPQAKPVVTPEAKPFLANARAHFNKTETPVVVPLRPEANPSHVGDFQPNKEQVTKPAKQLDINALLPFKPSGLTDMYIGDPLSKLQASRNREELRHKIRTNQEITEEDLASVSPAEAYTYRQEAMQKGLLKSPLRQPINGPAGITSSAAAEQANPAAPKPEEAKKKNFIVDTKAARNYSVDFEEARKLDDKVLQQNFAEENVYYRGMALNFKDIVNISKKGLLVSDTQQGSDLFASSVQKQDVRATFFTEDITIADMYAKTALDEKENSIPVIVKVNAFNPDNGLMATEQGIAKKGDIAASEIKGYAAVLKIYDTPVWGEIRVKDGVIVFSPYQNIQADNVSKPQKAAIERPVNEMDEMMTNYAKSALAKKVAAKKEAERLAELKELEAKITSGDLTESQQKELAKYALKNWVEKFNTFEKSFEEIKQAKMSKATKLTQLSALKKRVLNQPITEHWSQAEQSIQINELASAIKVYAQQLVQDIYISNSGDAPAAAYASDISFEQFLRTRPDLNPMGFKTNVFPDVFTAVPNIENSIRLEEIASNDAEFDEDWTAKPSTSSYFHDGSGIRNKVTAKDNTFDLKRFQDNYQLNRRIANIMLTKPDANNKIRLDGKKSTPVAAPVAKVVSENTEVQDNTPAAEQESPAYKVGNKPLKKQSKQWYAEKEKMAALTDPNVYRRKFTDEVATLVSYIYEYAWSTSKINAVDRAKVMFEIPENIKNALGPNAEERKNKFLDDIAANIHKFATATDNYYFIYVNNHAMQRDFLKANYDNIKDLMNQKVLDDMISRQSSAAAEKANNGAKRIASLSLHRALEFNRPDNANETIDILLRIKDNPDLQEYLPNMDEYFKELSTVKSLAEHRGNFTPEDIKLIEEYSMYDRSLHSALKNNPEKLGIKPVVVTPPAPAAPAVAKVAEPAVKPVSAAPAAEVKVSAEVKKETAANVEVAPEEKPVQPIETAMQESTIEHKQEAAQTVKAEQQDQGIWSKVKAWFKK